MSGKRRFFSGLARLTAVPVCIILQWLMIEYSMTEPGVIFGRDVVVNLLNLSVVAVVDGLLMFLLGSVRLSVGICNMLAMLLSVANRYTCDLHGAPIRISELATIGTAADVLSGYRIYLARTVLLTLVMFAAAAALLRIAYRTGKRRKHPVGYRVSGLLTAAVCCAALVLSFGTSTYRPSIGYNWPVAVNEWGYPLCLVEDTTKYISCTVEPRGYSDAAVAAAADRYDTVPGTGNMPDVIVILSETFYDPAGFAELGLQTDVPYLTGFYSIPDAARGLCVVPNGGTNSSEYELLTSNSKSLVNASAPFNFLQFSDANTVVSYMKSLGYETWALHGLGGTNYTRYKSWPEMGFDHVLFQADFTHEERYGKRYRTDAADYRQLIDCYEDGGDAPRFLYLLTYQNHGGWAQNDPEWDTVHCLTDLGDDTDIMSEYLTGISMSDEALQDLLAYFRTCDRDVVLMLVGDHMPVFLSSRNDELLLKDGSDESAAEYLKRTATPYLLWRNHGAAAQRPALVTMADMIPMTLQQAGLPLSRYYAALLTLQHDYPVRVTDYALDASGKLLRLTGGADIPQGIADSLILAYNNLQPLSDRLQSVFTADGR